MDRNKGLIEDLHQLALEAIAKKVAEEARRRAPVDTGKLRESIEPLVVDGKTVDVIANAPYAYFVETGARGREGDHFLEDALEDVTGSK
jgi:HK97 gp10 family phage protein